MLKLVPNLDECSGVGYAAIAVHLHCHSLANRNVECTTTITASSKQPAQHHQYSRHDCICRRILSRSIPSFTWYTNDQAAYPSLHSAKCIFPLPALESEDCNSTLSMFHPKQLRLCAAWPAGETWPHTDQCQGLGFPLCLSCTCPLQLSTPPVTISLQHTCTRYS